MGNVVSRRTREFNPSSANKASAVDHTVVVTFDGLQFAVQMPPVLVVFRGNADRTEHIGLATVPPAQYSEHFLDVDPIGLDSLLPSVLLDAGRVDDDILDTVVLQAAVNPETISSSFVATDYRRVFGKPKSFAGEIDFPSESGHAAPALRESSDREPPRLKTLTTILTWRVPLPCRGRLVVCYIGKWSLTSDTPCEDETNSLELSEQRPFSSILIDDTHSI